MLVGLLVGVLPAVAVARAAKPSTTHRARHTAHATTAQAPARAAPPRAAAPAWPDPALAKSLAALAREGTSRREVTGIAVFDLETNAWLYDHEGDRAFNPASVTKVVTTSTALRLLGSGYTFKTHLLRAGALTDGVLHGDLVVKGEGDPSITVERLWRIASLLRVAGVKEILGNIVVDDSYFDAERTGVGYEDFDDDRAYTAPLGAVSATWNTVMVAVRPGPRPGAPAEVVLDPPTGYVTLVAKAKTGRAGTRRRVKVTIDDHRVVTVTGSYPLGAPEKDYYRPIDDPPSYFGTLLSEYLAAGGVITHGKVKVGLAPASAEPLFDFESEPLGVIVRDLNKFSNNFTAEQILKAVGAARYGAPGSTAKGLAAEKEFLDSLGVPPSSYTIQNGSGLTRDNRISPKLFAKVLAADWDDFQVRGDFIASLGIAGEDGTLRHRMIGTAAQGALRGKTGTVDDSSCIAGYVRAANGHTLAYAILMNGTMGRTHHAVWTQDRIGATLASWNGSGAAPAAPDEAVAAAALPTPHAAAAPDLTGDPADPPKDTAHP